MANALREKIMAEGWPSFFLRENLNIAGNNPISMLRKFLDKFRARMDRRAHVRDFAENALNFALDREKYAQVIAGTWPAHGTPTTEISCIPRLRRQPKR